MTNPKHLFFDDYSEGAHPAILEAIVTASTGQHATYGRDELSVEAGRRIREFFGADLDVHLVSGGTQANIVGLASMLRNYEGVIAASSSHINAHETGAIEATGHKIICVDSPDGKLTPDLISEAAARHEDEHTVLPRVVSITHSTEIGTVYSHAELSAVTEAARSHQLYTFVDGARLSMGLDASDMQPSDLATCGVDMFYVGGTKVGGAFGEAIAIANPKLANNFRYEIKQRGALMAKGSIIGAQFRRFFAADRLWEELGRKTNANAAALADELRDVVEFVQQPESNQLFVALPNSVLDELHESWGFYDWTPGIDRTVARFVCSWATPIEAIQELGAHVRKVAS